MLAFLVFVVILSLLIFVHEFGHFLAAKKTGVKVEEFGFGYPPRIWGKKIKGTIYSLNWLPFGGFVRLYGENYLEKEKKAKGALFSKPKRVRVLVALAGVLGNFLLGIVCFSIIYSFIGIPTKVNYVIIEEIAQNSPASLAGLKPGQIIKAVGKQPITSASQFVEAIKNYQGKEVSLWVSEDETATAVEYRLIPRVNPPAGEGAIGVAISSVKMVFYPAWQMPFRGAVVGFQEAINWGLMIFWSLKEAIVSLFSGVVPQVAGPLGIYEITSGVVKKGWLLTLQFTGVLSINLAILNLLPIPALDGSRLIFIAIEAITRRRVKPKIEEYIHLAGMAFLITLMLLVTYNDFSRIFKNNPFWQDILNSIIREINFLFP